MLRELVVAALVALLFVGLVSPAGASGALDSAEPVIVNDVVENPENVTDADETTGDATTAVGGTDDSTTGGDSELTVDGSTEGTVTETDTTVDDTGETDQTVDETVTEAEEFVDETTTGAQEPVTETQRAIEETGTATQETVDETVSDVEGTVDDTVTETDEIVTGSEVTADGTSKTLDEAERTVDRAEESVDRSVDETGAVDDTGGTVEDVARVTDGTEETANETLTGVTGALEDRTTQTLFGTIEGAGAGQVVSDVTSTAPPDATTGDPAPDGPSTVAATARFTDVGAATTAAEPGSDGQGPSQRGGAVGIGAVLAVALIHRGATGASLCPDIVQQVWVSVGRMASPGGERVRFWRFISAFRYSRYDDSDPLEHERRAALYERVRDFPGENLSSLAEGTDVPLSTARHHLRVLEQEGLVVDRKIRGKRRFVPLGADNDERVAALRDEATAQVLDALARNGPSSVSALADDLDRDPSTVSYHLDGLEEAALVERRREGRAVVNSLTPTARTLLDVHGDSAPWADHRGDAD